MEGAAASTRTRALRLGAATGLRIVEARAERALGLLELGAGASRARRRRTCGSPPSSRSAHGLGSPVLLDWPAT